MAKDVLKFPLLIQENAYENKAIVNDVDELVAWLSEEGFEFGSNNDLDGYELWPVTIENGKMSLGDTVQGDNIKFSASYSFKVK